MQRRELSTKVLIDFALVWGLVAGLLLPTKTFGEAAIDQSLSIAGPSLYVPGPLLLGLPSIPKLEHVYGSLSVSSSNEKVIGVLLIVMSAALVATGFAGIPAFNSSCDLNPSNRDGCKATLVIGFGIGPAAGVVGGILTADAFGRK